MSRTTRVDALSTARLTTLSPDLVGPVELTPPVRRKYGRLVRAGWSPESYARLRAMAAHTVRTGGALAAVYQRAAHQGQTLSRPVEVLVVEHLTLAGEAAADARARFEEVEPWLWLLAAAGDSTHGRTLRESIHYWENPDIPQPLSQWWTRLGPMAPLAWAAGLDLDEAAAAVEAGTLDEAGLQTLAMLRGFRLDLSVQ